jgi:hypothetical protein
VTSPLDTGDLAFQLAQALLGRMVQRLTDQGRAPARAFVSADVAAPEFADPCGGVAWTRIASVGVGTAQATPDINPYGQPPVGYSTLIEAGIYRCQVSPVTAKGKAKRPDQITGEALDTARDRTALLDAVACDFPTDIAEADCDGWTVSPWLPITDYVGGWLTVTVNHSIVH